MAHFFKKEEDILRNHAKLIFVRGGRCQQSKIHVFVTVWHLSVCK